MFLPRSNGGVALQDLSAGIELNLMMKRVGIVRRDEEKEERGGERTSVHVMTERKGKLT